MSRMWEFRGQKRPTFAAQPKPGQESVWDYPRPPIVETCQRLVEVFTDDHLLARAHTTYRVLETASPPTFYLPPETIDWSQLIQANGSSLCEWKGLATYWSLAEKPDSAAVAWQYRKPHPEFAMLRDFTSFYPGRVACYVEGERVRPQPGEFYGGWITNELVGPFKGEPGTEHW